MKSRLVMLPLSIALTAILVPISQLSPFIQAQSPPRERPELKDFGSSLKRLKWDPEKHVAVETKAPAAVGKPPTDEDIVRIETNLVVCDVQVRDRQGRTVQGLTKSDFIVAEAGSAQQIEHFSLGSDLTVSRSIVLIIDYSGSLRSYMNESITAAEILVDQLGPKDTMAIVTDDVSLLVDFTGDRGKLKKVLESLRKKADENHFGNSFQFSALMAAVRELFSVEDIRPIVIFQTDGDEVGLLQPPDPRYFFLPLIPAGLPPEQKKRMEELTARDQDRIGKSLFKPFSLKDVFHEIEKSRATVYTVIPGRNLIGLPADEQVKTVRTALESLQSGRKKTSARSRMSYSEEQFELITRLRLRAQTAAAGAAIVSGGWTAFLEAPEQAGSIYSTILSDINSRYVIGYYPANKTHDGKRRDVLVEVRNHPDYVVTGRKSYYAPEPEQ